MNKLQALISLIEMLESGGSAKENPITRPALAELSGQHLIVADRGFVYVGEISRDGDFLRVEDAKNVRVWGTSNGLGELVEGPTKSTVTDHVGTVLIPMKALISLIPCKGF